MAEIVLETTGLTKYYGGRLAVDHLDLKVPRGCICGFLGRNGAGKTTVIKMLLGLLEPTAGSARLLGCDNTVKDQWQAGHKQGAQAAAGGDQPQGETLRIIVLAEGRINQGSDGDDGNGTGARESRENGAGD